jgi:D-proline reductase (dithiol) PrdB
MARLRDLPLRHRAFLKAYRWRRIDPTPWTPLGRPLSRTRLALVSSAGLTLTGQERFDHAFKGGDPSFREIPGDVDPAALEDHHRSRSFDHEGMRRDPNVAFPVERVRELARDGVIGSVAPRHLSFMGSVTAPGRLIRDAAPRAAELLVSDRVDAALLVPV